MAIDGKKETEASIREEEASTTLSRQEAKSAAMRIRVLDATLLCLVEYGYAGTTTTLVAQEADVSRGAMLHHFATKTELVTQTVIHVAEKLIDDFRVSVAQIPQSANFLSSVIDLMWANFSSNTAYAMLELIIAARTSRELFDSLQPVVKRYEQIVFETAGDLFGPFAPTKEEFFHGSRMLYFLMHGLAVTNILRDDANEQEKFLLGIKKFFEHAVRVRLQEVQRRGQPATQIDSPI